MSQGRDFKLWIENVGDTDYLEVIGQGDMDLNLGKTSNTEKTKNDQQSFISDEGVSATMTLDLANPQRLTDIEIYAAHDGEVPVKCKIEEDVAGGLAYSGLALIVIGTIAAPIEGVQRAQISIAFEGIPTRGVSPVAYA